MSHLALVASNRMVERTSAGHMAHDLRNLLTTVGLHLETLQRLAGPHGSKAACSAQALIGKAATLCSAVLAAEGATDGRPRRGGVDVSQVARDVAALLRPTAPPDFAIEIDSENGGIALADPNAVFRILFNLVGNAVAVARSGKLTKLSIAIAREAQTVIVRLTDNGPGLPAAVRKNLFRSPPATSAHGHGLAIVRELVERNGGTIALMPARKGAAFTVTLPALAAMVVAESPLTRSLGQRAAR